MRSTLVDTKNSDIANNFDRINKEHNDQLKRYKLENDRLSHENVDLHSRLSALHRDIER